MDTDYSAVDDCIDAVQVDYFQPGGKLAVAVAAAVALAQSH